MKVDGEQYFFIRNALKFNQTVSWASTRCAIYIYIYIDECAICTICEMICKTFNNFSSFLWKFSLKKISNFLERRYIVPVCYTTEVKPDSRLSKRKLSQNVKNWSIASHTGGEFNNNFRVNKATITQPYHVCVYIRQHTQNYLNVSSSTYIFCQSKPTTEQLQRNNFSSSVTTKCFMMACMMQSLSLQQL